ncbi:MULTISPECIES: transglycosylase domain-containing protein [unclassified Proteiniphilum]|jgi:penicillin-binding protein 1A|uniref:transglycosylase domain-containing protein n=2 Tax=Dysgonomonadaceae TaxID=2005520 RepID=UPI0039C938B5|nr:transglycosylase domain-containing protein [Proteiniphilum propionicum]
MGKKKKAQKRASKTKKVTGKYDIVKAMWSLFGLMVAGAALFFLLVSAGLVGYLPEINELENPIDKYASQVISSDNELLFTYSQSDDNRIFVDYSDLSPYLIDALISTEDVRYYSHSGIDIIGLGRAVFKTLILNKGESGGGSTITQQLAKLLYSPRANNKLQRVFQKPVEWVIAAKLERFYSKDEIINLYLNKYDFNYNAVGIESAARTYFNKTPDELSVDESAMLIGMLKNSSLYNPVRRPEVTKERRNVVLSQMQKAGHLKKQQADSLKQLPIELDFNRSGHIDIAAPYYRQHLAKMMMAVKPQRKNYASWKKQQFTEDSLSWEEDPLYGWCNKNKKPDGSNYNIYTDGLKIYSTIDSRMQRYAEAAVKEHLGGYLQKQFFSEKAGRKYAPYSVEVSNQVDDLMTAAMKQTERYRVLKKGGLSEAEIIKNFKEVPVEMKVFSWEHREIDTLMTPWDSIRYHKNFLRAGFMAMDPLTGHVKAYVGGPDFKFFKYDMVSTGKRQIGSTIKPYLYTLAMEEGMTPCDGMIHGPVTLMPEVGEPWEPRNTRKASGEFVSIKWGLQNSDNWVTAWLMKQFSPYTFARMLQSFGLKTPADPVVSLALGPNDASVYEMVGAYSSFINRGIRVEPVLVTRIEDQFGNEVYSSVPRMKEIFSESTSYKMLDMLKAVIDGGSGGRLRRLYNLKGQMGGKTGTTNNNSDGWFMSFTPNLVAGCWVGGEDPSIHFDRMAYGQGASMALPIHGLFYQKIYADRELKYSDDGVFDIPAEFDPCHDSKRYSPDFYRNDDPMVESEGIDDIFN